MSTVETRLRPLTAAQRGLWFARALTPDDGAFTTAQQVVLDGDVDRAALLAAVDTALAESPWLRARFATGPDGVPEQEPGAWPVEIGRTHAADLTGWTAGETARALDPEREPPLRATLVELGPRRTAVHVTAHHLVLDAYGYSRLWARIAALYSATVGGTVPPPAPAVGLDDVLAAEARYADSAAARADRSHWERVLRATEPAPRLAPGAGGLAGRVRTRTVELTGDLTGALVRLADRAGASWADVLVAGVAGYLAAWTGVADQVLALPSMNRTRTPAARVPGVAVTVLPLPLRVTPETTPVGLVRAAAAALADARAHGRQRGEDLAPLLRGGPGPAVNLKAFTDRLAFAGAHARQHSVRRGPVHDLTVTVGPVPGTDRWELVLDADADHYPAEALDTHVTGLVRHLGALADPAAATAPLARITLARAPRPEVRESTMASVVDGFAAAAAGSPDTTAVVAGAVRLTYAELDERVETLARGLAAGGASPGSVVLVALERTVDLVVALLAVARTGAAYLPVEPDAPADRLRTVLDDTRPVLAVAEPGLRARVDLPPAPAPDGPARDFPRPHPDEAAYLLSTSGSTGAPKTVVVTGRNVAALFAATREAFGVPAAGGVWSCTHSLAFDFSVWELWGPLAHGGTLVLATSEEIRDPAALTALVRRERVTVLSRTPSAFALLVEHLEGAGAHGLAVEHVVFGGEALDPAVVGRWRALPGAPAARLTNMYGITETTVHVTHHEVDADASVGRALPGLRVSVRNPALQRLPAGATGEIYVSGPQVARGYLGRPGLTATRFVADPDGPPGSRCYRSGDLGACSPAGTLDHRGRADDQVKIRGHRIELGEVEAALLAEPGVRRAVVRAVGSAQARRLVAWVVGDPPDVAGLRSRLPAYMVPAAIVPVAAIPLTRNGKLDRRALPDPAPTPGREISTDPAELLVRELMGELLEVPVAPADDFFARGGHSLLATRLAARLRARTGAAVGVPDVFAAPTPAALAALLRERTDPATPALRRGPDTDEPTSMQRRAFLLDRLDRDGATFAMPLRLRLAPGTDVSALEAALTDVVARHEPLRTTFEERDGRVRAVVGAPAPVPLALRDTDDVERTLGELARVPFDLAVSPLRATLVRGPETLDLLLVIHHIAGDEWSMDPLLHDLAQARRAREAGRAPEFAPLPVRYRDLAGWELETFGPATAPTAYAQAAEAHWRAALADLPEPAELPADGERRGTRGAEVTVDVGPADALHAAAAASRTTPFMVAHAAVALLLQKLGAGTDVVVGSLVAVRPDAVCEDLVGFFVNTVVLRTDLTGDPTLAELLDRVRAVDVAAYAHADLPFERATGGRPGPLFRTLVQYRQAPDGPDAPELIGTGTAKTDLSFEFTEAAGRLRLRLEHAVPLFSADGVRRVAERLERVLAALTGDRTRRLSQVDVLAADERALIESASRRPAPPAADETVDRLVSRRVRAAPHRTALVAADRRMDYATLDTEVDRLARALAARGVGPGTVVGLGLPRTSDLVVGMLGVLRAGGAYLPLDPAYPRDRLRYMLEEARPTLVLTTAATRDRFPDPLDLGDIPDLPDLPAEADEPAPLRPARPSDAVHVVFTSGSTGPPKGVVGTHAAMVERVRWQDALWPVGEPDVRLSLSSLSFIDGSTEVLGALTAGATLVLADEATVRDLGRTAALVRAERVSQVLTVPSVVRALAEAAPEVLGEVRTWAVGGEPVTTDLIARFTALAPGSTLLDTYGSSEVSGDVLTGPLSPERGERLGAPVPGTAVQVLDELLTEVPPGVVGELYVGGPQLARGYHRRPALTAERFVAGPDGGRLYRTGDLVRREPDGGLRYVGRRDFVVNVRGLRIGLGEIEAVLRAQPDVDRAVVAVRGAALVGYLVPGPHAAPGVAERATAALHTRLPAHLVPGRLVELPELPLLPNGKVDRRSLPEPTGTARAVPPRTPAEESLCAVVTDLVGVDGVGIDDDFFGLGGDSIGAMRLVAAARTAGLVLDLADVFEWRTVRRIAERAGRSAGTDAAGPDSAGPDSGGPGSAGAGSARPVPLTATAGRLRDSGLPRWVGRSVRVDATFAEVGAMLEGLVATRPALRTAVRGARRATWRTVARADVPAGLVRRVSGSPEQVLAELAAELDLPDGVAVRAGFDGSAPGGPVLSVVTSDLAAGPWELAALLDELRRGAAEGPAAARGARGLAHWQALLSAAAPGPVADRPERRASAGALPGGHTDPLRAALAALRTVLPPATVAAVAGPHAQVPHPVRLDDPDPLAGGSEWGRLRHLDRTGRAVLGALPEPTVLVRALPAHTPGTVAAVAPAEPERALVLDHGADGLVVTSRTDLEARTVLDAWRSTPASRPTPE